MIRFEFGLGLSLCLEASYPRWNETEEMVQFDTRGWNTAIEERNLRSLEARVGFEPTNGGFADLSLGPLGYRAELLSIANLPKLFGHLPSDVASAKFYFFSTTEGIFASRKNRADSSCGVGLM